MRRRSNTPPPIGTINNKNKIKHYRQHDADTRSYYIFTSGKNVNLKFQGFPRGNLSVKYVINEIVRIHIRTSLTITRSVVHGPI